MAHRFYDSTRWRNLRDMVIARHPLCEQCKSKGLTTIATQVDHILPIEEGGNPTDWTNLQPLCASCHSKKTRQENEPEKNIAQTMGYADAIITSKVVTKRGRPKKVKEAQGSDMSNDKATKQDISHKDDNNSVAGGTCIATGQ